MACSRVFSRMSAAKTTDTHAEKINRSTKWLCNNYFRPIEMSYASMTTSAFSKPATIRNVLPYS